MKHYSERDGTDASAVDVMGPKSSHHSLFKLQGIPTFQINQQGHNNTTTQRPARTIKNQTEAHESSWSKKHTHNREGNGNMKPLGKDWTVRVTWCILYSLLLAGKKGASASVAAKSQFHGGVRGSRALPVWPSSSSSSSSTTTSGNLVSSLEAATEQPNATAPTPRFHPAPGPSAWHPVIHRQLHMPDFVPLSCNGNLRDAPCHSWSSTFGSRAVFDERLVIECGTCVELDPLLDANVPPKVTFVDGLDIRGRFLMKHKVEIAFYTPLIVVQGEWIVLARQAVTGTPSVRVVLTGDDDTQFFEPIHENANKCEGNLCQVGPKAITIAGGRIRGKPIPVSTRRHVGGTHRGMTHCLPWVCCIVEPLSLSTYTARGLPNDTPTWTKLHTVHRAMESPGSHGPPFHPYNAPPMDAGCNANGTYFGINFVEQPSGDNNDHCPSGDEFHVTPGSKTSCSNSNDNNMFQVVDRTSTRHGIQLDLKQFRHCLETTRTYLLTIRVRLYDTTNNDDHNNGSVRTECALSESQCLRVEHEYMTSDFERTWSTVWNEPQALRTTYGTVITIVTELEFASTALDATNVYQLLRLVGPGAGVNLHVEEFHLFLPPASLYNHDPACTGNALHPSSGDAESGIYSPFPLYVTHEWIYATIEEDAESDNHFFQIRGRTNRDREKSGLAWDVNPHCLQEGAYLR